MGNETYTEDRAKDMLFSTIEQGSETFYFYVLTENVNYVKSDISVLNGKKIGINAGFYQVSLFKEWCVENNIKCELVEYHNDEQRKRS